MKRRALLAHLQQHGCAAVREGELGGRPGRWPLAGKLIYLLLCLAFRRIYGGQGMAADGVRRRRLGAITQTIIKIGISAYNSYYRKRVSRPWVRPAPTA